MNVSAPLGGRLSTRELSVCATRLYRHANLAPRLLQTYRPYICPFDALIPLVPAHSSVLDVGCGAGLFLNLLALAGGTARRVGFDASQPAIDAARSAAESIAPPERPDFMHLDVGADWPDGSWDVVTLIDVMHHIPPAAQPGVIRRASRALAPGGILIYKDMVSAPLWQAAANRLHDLLLARQWIHYAPLRDVERWSHDAGLHPVAEGRRRMLWYGHEWLVLKKEP